MYSYLWKGGKLLVNHVNDNYQKKMLKIIDNECKCSEENKRRLWSM